MATNAKPKSKRRSGHTSGMQGVFLVAAELAGREFIVSPTSRSAAGADLLVTDENCTCAYTVQVKTNRPGNSRFWVMGEKPPAVSASHLYVFVNLKKKEPPAFYVVPSEVVASGTYPQPSFSPCFDRDEQWRDRWDLFAKGTSD